jgi:DNA (cytosine-5)-methyltransferase 1
MAKYTTVRSKLKFDSKKFFTEEDAYFTHYLHFPFLKEKPDYDFIINQFSDDLQNEINDFDSPITYWDIPFPPPENPAFTFIDLFAGIGGIRLAFQQLGGQCVFSSEWDKFARKTYEANFGEVPFGDITKIDENKILNHDILTGGFPCQPFSIAGVSKKNSLGRSHGFKDKTQGTLFFDIARIIEAKRPKAFLLENVKNLKSHDSKNTFKIIKGTLEELDYTVFEEILDARYYIPQHRERILIVGFDNKRYQNVDFKFPIPPESKQVLNSILEKKTDEKYTLSDKLWNYLKDYAEKHKMKGNGFGFGIADPNGVSRTLSARYYKDGSEILIAQENKNPRRLTPKECAKLQGYPKEFRVPVSDNQAYKQFGNSVAVPMIEAVAKEIIKKIIHEP